MPGDLFACEVAICVRNNRCPRGGTSALLEFDLHGPAEKVSCDIISSGRLPSFTSETNRLKWNKRTLTASFHSNRFNKFKNNFRHILREKSKDPNLNTRVPSFSTCYAFEAARRSLLLLAIQALSAVLGLSKGGKPPRLLRQQPRANSSCQTPSRSAMLGVRRQPPQETRLNFLSCTEHIQYGSDIRPQMHVRDEHSLYRSTHIYLRQR